MKKYIGSKEIRLVGKAWEIRHSLRQLDKRDAAASVQQRRSLASYLAHASSKA
ncbi:Z-ring formation inhibitor MciZ [Paenibacillus beijingensis]|uniref:Z-ring formation inhibitor MciZ n=1 Tax=Paenibacillus beijingensis TaxID=1126833 RepID=UPI0009E464C1|nr:Z-ring formation inhibitor MciZ [Paenibacillus beijingensis]